MRRPKPQNFAIGLLSTTAAILFVGLLLLDGQSRSAQAEGMTTSNNGYIMTVGRLNQGDEEIVYLVDSTSDKLIAYRFDSVRRQIEIVQGINLSEMRKPSQP